MSEAASFLLIRFSSLKTIPEALTLSLSAKIIYDLSLVQQPELQSFEEADQTEPIRTGRY